MPGRFFGFSFFKVSSFLGSGFVDVGRGDQMAASGGMHMMGSHMAQLARGESKEWRDYGSSLKEDATLTSHIVDFVGGESLMLERVDIPAMSHFRKKMVDQSDPHHLHRKR